MDQDEIQRFADSNNLDVRPIMDYHFRLMDTYGNFVLDVYIKRNKGGVIVKNTVLQWRTKKWFVAKNQKDLNKLIRK